MDFPGFFLLSYFLYLTSVPVTACVDSCRQTPLWGKACSSLSPP